jgi:peptidoglycan/xylan/chitin deacetylase (PgdA/CDA1 family)
MQLSWFPRPIYRIVNFAAISGMACCGWYIWFASAGWFFFILILFITATILIGSSFIISSGVYVTTICKGNKNKNEIAITFDDGPGEQTKKILNLLDQHKAKATFFLTGRNADLHKDMVSEIAQKQHSIGNHTYSHKSWFPLIGTNKINEELNKTQNTIASVTGYKPIYFRPPYGITNPFIARALKKFNFKTIGWSIRSLDTVIKDPEKIIKRILKKIGPGAIILMHDDTINAVYVLEKLLIYCQQNNLKAVNLDELLNE